MRENKAITKCQYTEVCYLAELLQCYGYKLDCVLYAKIDGATVTEEDFHKVVNELIEREKTHISVPR